MMWTLLRHQRRRIKGCKPEKLSLWFSFQKLRKKHLQRSRPEPLASSSALICTVVCSASIETDGRNKGLTSTPQTLRKQLSVRISKWKPVDCAINVWAHFKTEVRLMNVLLKKKSKKKKSVWHSFKSVWCVASTAAISPHRIWRDAQSCCLNPLLLPGEGKSEIWAGEAMFLSASQQLNTCWLTSDSFWSHATCLSVQTTSESHL